MITFKNARPVKLPSLLPARMDPEENKNDSTNDEILVVIPAVQYNDADEISDVHPVVQYYNEADEISDVHPVVQYNNIDEMLVINSPDVPPVVQHSDADEISDVPPVVPCDKNPMYVHPLLQLLDPFPGEAVIIEALQAFVGCRQIGTDPAGSPIYEIVDQVESLAPVLQVFTHAATYGYLRVVEWLIDNYVPLDVSYDDNYVYFECVRWGQIGSIDMMIRHESFHLSISVLVNMLCHGYYLQFLKCLAHPHLPEYVRIHQLTLMQYLQQGQYQNALNLLKNILETRSSNQSCNQSHSSHETINSVLTSATAVN